MKNTLLFIFLFAVFLCSPSRGEEEDVSRTAAQSLRSVAAQTELPDPLEAASQSLRSLDAQIDLPVDGERSRPPRPSDDPAPVISAETAQMMLWAALAILAGVILVTILDNLRPLPASAADRRGNAPDETGAVRQRMTAAQGEADTLAATGKYAEAMHVLLLQSLGEMRRRLGVPIAVSLTSREIRDRVAMRPEADEALGDIINRVEISYFGDHVPDAGEYARCRRSYATLTGLLNAEGGNG